ncbi:MAG: nucleotidyltransferase family protein [Ruminococcus sp.]|nr:nucleotidyltransferase family protein [Ruminococcus sp.]
MEKEVFRKISYDMIYLVRCAMYGVKPDKNRVEAMDLEALFDVCQTHILTACTAYALESVGVRNKAFTEAKEKAVRKNILLDVERAGILSSLEQEGIWYMPLKGALLKDWYPKLGMRQMSDNDILCDPEFREKIREIMQARGFTTKYGLESDDDYYKEPVYNFEMHHTLFRPSFSEKMYEYFNKTKSRMLKDKGNNYGYHFSPEDFYIYLIAHEYKHYASGGTGVRSLVDTFVFVRKFRDELDWNYLRGEFSKLGILGFERRNRSLAIKLFTGKELTEEQKEMLDYYITSGVYGTLDNKVKHKVDRYGNGSKAKYVFHRIFPTMDYIKYHWNFFYRHKWLIPVLWIYRPFHGLKVNGTKIMDEIKVLRK